MNFKKIWILALWALAPVYAAAAAESDFFLIHDFNNSGFVNRVGGSTGKWELEPDDKSQWCNISFSTSHNAISEKSGASLRMDYNIATNKENYIAGQGFSIHETGTHARSFNGLYMLLNKFNAKPYRYLSFFAKGDAQEGFTRSFKVELKDGQRSVPVSVHGLTDSWQAFNLPLSEFSSTINLSTLTEFVIVFDQNITRNKGTIYLDQIGFSKKKEIQKTP